MEYYSAIKKNEIMKNSSKWAELGKIEWTEVTQT